MEDKCSALRPPRPVSLLASAVSTDNFVCVCVDAGVSQPGRTSATSDSEVNENRSVHPLPHVPRAGR